MMQKLEDEGGNLIGYFQNIEVKTDRLTCDGIDYPIVMLGAYSITPEDPPAAEEPFDVPQACADIDNAVLAIYQRPVILSKEYEQREAQAQAFKDAGYPQDAVPPRVLGFATPAGLSPQEATDTILLQAAELRGALDQLSDLRMKKYAVMTAQGSNAARNVYQTTMDAIALIASQLG